MPYYHFLKKVTDVLSKLDHSNSLNEKCNKFKLMMAMHADEINIQMGCFFLNQSFLGPSHNDPDNLAKCMLFLLLTSLTGEKKQ